MIPRTASEIMFQMQQDTKSEFGEEFDTTESSDWYRENMPVAIAMKIFEDKILDYSSNVNLRTASDPYFYEGASNFLFQRKLPTKASGYVVTSDSAIGAVAEIGEIKLRKVGTDLIYKNTSKVTVNTLPFEIAIQSELTGSINNADPNEVIEIVSIPPNFGTFTNAYNIAGGQDLEELEEARKRFFNQGSSQAKWNQEGVKSAILRVDGVNSAFVRVNNTDNTIDTQPRRSLWCVVDGGKDEDIANAIFETFTDATYTYGAVRVNVLDVEGVPVEIGFDRPTEIDIFVQIDVFGTKDVATITDKVKEYIQTVSVGGVVSSSELIRNYIDVTQYKNIDITFKKSGTSNFVSYIQLGSTEKARYGG